MCRYMMDKLYSQCERALVSGVMVSCSNIFDLARIAMNFSCFSHSADSIMEKCARFLKTEISRNFRILKEFDKEDYDIFQVWNEGINIILFDCSL